MRRLLSFELWLVLSLVWTGVVAYFAYKATPQLPLDLGGPEGEAALRAEMFRHLVRYSLFAIVPPFVLLGFLRLFRR